MSMRAVLLVAFLVTVVTLHAAEPQVAYPKVGMAVGSALLYSVGGGVVPLKSGQSLPPGSRIQTGADAVVVLVFPDNARVSLRADSDLVIHQYALDPTGHATQMELELLRGALRQISGTAAHAQPERYRLKTPIAAIGVRGTDFLAQSQGQSLETFVNEGAIVVTPNASICTKSTTCDPINLVSGASQGAFLRLQNTGQVERKQLDFLEVERLFGIGIASVGMQKEHGSSSGAAFYTVINPIVFMAAPRTAAEPSGYISTLLGSVVPPVPNSPETVTAVTQLVWGRFGNQPELLQYPMLLPYEEASQGRHVRVGVLGQFGLWRSNPNGDLQSGLSGQVDFRLNQGQAFLHQSSQVSPANIERAQLNIDFDRSAFSTSMAISHQQTGMQNINLSGRVNSEGLFNAVSAQATDRVAGALSRDGSEAGMLFVKQLPQGSLQGVTLWQR